MQTDNKTLVECINKCFALAANSTIPEDEQKFYFDRGDLLRKRLVTLLHADFTQGTASIKQANSKLKEVNKILKERLQGLQSAANTVDALGNLVSIIDDLFKLPFNFI